MDEIITEAAALFEITPAELRSVGRRSPHIAHARQAVWYALARRRPRLSLAEIARRFDCDHSTVIYGIGAAERRAVYDIDYALRMAALISGAHP